MYTIKSKHQQLIIGSLSLLFCVVIPGFADENVLQRLEKDFQRVVTDARPAVVKVVATQVMSVPLPSNTKELALIRQNIGSGIVIDTAGHIVTTTFEMGPPSKIEVIFSDKKVFSAKLIGTDIFTDIAVLRIANTPRESHHQRMPSNQQPLTSGSNSHHLVSGAILQKLIPVPGS